MMCELYFGSNVWKIISRGGNGASDESSDEPSDDPSDDLFEDSKEDRPDYVIK